MSATGAKQVDLLLVGLRDTSGNVLSAGKVYTYAAGTATPKTVWTDEAKTTPAANPVVLDSAGQASIFADGEYKFVVKDSGDATIYTWDDLSFLKRNIDQITELVASGGITLASMVQFSAGGIKFVLPVMTTAQRNALSAANGMVLYNSTDSQVQAYVGGSWTAVGVGSIKVSGDDTTSNYLDSKLLVGKSLNKTVNNPAGNETITLEGTAGVPGSNKNLVLTTDGKTDQQVAITADHVLLGNASGFLCVVNTVSLTLDLSTSGANGLDSGPLAANTAYYIWVIYNPTTDTVAALGSTGAPSLPSGYTYYAVVGWCTTDATADPFNIEEFTQIEDEAIFDTKQKVVSIGGSTSTASVNLAAAGALSYAVFPASIGRGIWGRAYLNAAANTLMVNPKTFANSMAISNAVVEYMIYGTAATWNGPWYLKHLQESQKFYYQLSNGAGTVDLYVCGFSLRL